MEVSNKEVNNDPQFPPRIRSVMLLTFYKFVASVKFAVQYSTLPNCSLRTRRRMNYASNPFTYFKM